MGTFIPMARLAADVSEYLQAINVEEHTIREIVTILIDGADDLRGGRPAGVSPAVFGGSGNGSSLGHHTSIAHRHVVEAMTDMVKGLHGYEQNVRRFNDDMTWTDEESGDGSRRTTDRVASAPVPTVPQAGSCTQAPDFTNTEPCSISGGDR